jgi:hypothetical protein
MPSFARIFFEKFEGNAIVSKIFGLVPKEKPKEFSID